MTKRLMKYNPAFLTDEELIQSFTVRQADLEMLLQILKENTTAASNQHVLVIGPRGSGKTTLVLRAAAEVRRTPELAEKWHPLAYAEESYEVGTAGEFWLEALFHLSQKTGDPRWQRTYEELRTEKDEVRLRERALAALMDFADSQGKRFLLIVENLNMLLANQISSDDAWALRHTLQNEPRIMLLATATSRFEQIDNPDQPMFELFKQHELRSLDEAECRAVWTAIAGNEPDDRRTRPIQILTGGNPRLLAIISSFGAKLSYRDLMGDLMRLVDDHTEYFKSHLDNLAHAERKVYLALAELWDPAIARDVAQKARMDVNKTSSLLGRLVNRGAVTVVEQSPRVKWYQVAERMYNIYHIMRRRGEPSNRVRAVVRFMVSFYGQEELMSAVNRLVDEACSLESDSCRDHYAAFEAICRKLPSEELRSKIISATPIDFFDGPNAPETLKALFLPLADEPQILPEEEAARLLAEAKKLVKTNGSVEAAVALFHEVIAYAPDIAEIWQTFGAFLAKAKRYEEAEEACRKAIELEPDNDRYWSAFGQMLADKKRFEEAENAFRKAISLKPDHSCNLINLGIMFEKAERYDEAEKNLKKAIDLEPDNAIGFRLLGGLLMKLNRYEEAEIMVKKALELKPDEVCDKIQLGIILTAIKRYNEAEMHLRKALDMNPDKDCAGCAWGYLGQIFESTDCLSEAESAYSEATELLPGSTWARQNLIRVLTKQERYDEAKTAARNAIDSDPRAYMPYVRLIDILFQQDPGNQEESLEVAREGTEKHPSEPRLLNELAWAFYKHGDQTRLEQALLWAREAVDLNPDSPVYHHTLGCILCRIGKGEEALSSAAIFLRAPALAETSPEDAAELFIGLAASGCGPEALALLRDSSSAQALEPLVAGLALFIGEDVKAAVEIVEVGKDVVCRIQNRQEEWENKFGKRLIKANKDANPLGS